MRTALVSVGPGTLEDYLRLAHHHYHQRTPRSVAGVLVARCAAAPEPIGVLVLAMPVLNAPWRDLAFPGRYRSADRAADARRLNAEVRTIARVVVDPRYRGLGVARLLVRSYLDAPRTPVTDAVAAMGSFSGFFGAAGMRAYVLPPSQRDLRLADAIASLGIDPGLLADPELIPARILASALLRREVRRWAMASRATRGALRLGLVEMLRRAARIYHPPTAYVAVQETS